MILEIKDYQCRIARTNTICKIKDKTITRVNEPDAGSSGGISNSDTAKEFLRLVSLQVHVRSHHLLLLTLLVYRDKEKL